MKTIFTIAAILLCTGLFAGNDKGQPTNTQTTQVATAITDYVNSNPASEELGICGQADVTIQLDDQGIVHVESVQTDDYTLEYHIRQTLDGAKMMVSDSLLGKTVSFIMNVVQSK